ncbi:MAG: hypothetical protein N2450_04335 [bacterium]|nr:hypothetical protein [bacterium]
MFPSSLTKNLIQKFTLIFFFLFTSSLAKPINQDSIFLSLLQTIDLSPNDFSLSLSQEDKDTFRLEIVDQLLTSSIQLEEKAKQFIDSIPYLTYLDGHKVNPTDSIQFKWEQIVNQSITIRNEFWKDIPEYEKKEILEKLPTIYEESDELEDLDIFSLYALREASADSFRQFVKLIKKIPKSIPWEDNFQQLLGFVLQLKPDSHWNAFFGDLNFSQHPNVLGKTLAWKSTQYGEIVIGSVEDNLYRGNFAVVIDVGGNDTYFGKVAAADETCPVSFLIDFEGNDLYSCDSAFSMAGSINGISLLLDYKGNDTYRGNLWVQGAAICGISMLVDKDGFDSFVADRNAQGCAAFGKGYVYDFGKNDIYQVRMYGQGVGLVNGYGTLYDKTGDDQYLATPRYTDVLRYQDHSLTLSQGFGYGLRPYFSGGIGILYDVSGSDLYVSDIYGQGASYWYALGILWDQSGNDRYLSYQYAQGSGIHISLGLLHDESGDDVYISKGVSQGCGHDYGTGWLQDKNGNDAYQCSELSQGAGSANGIGIMIDDEGDDVYMNRNSEMTLGYGNPRRDYGSIGIFMDKGGTDRYADIFAKDGGYWQRGIRGVGIDLNRK